MSIQKQLQGAGIESVEEFNELEKAFWTTIEDFWHAENQHCDWIAGVSILKLIQLEWDKKCVRCKSLFGHVVAMDLPLDFSDPLQEQFALD